MYKLNDIVDFFGFTIANKFQQPHSQTVYKPKENCAIIGIRKIKERLCYYIEHEQGFAINCIVNFTGKDDLTWRDNLKEGKKYLLVEENQLMQK
jgi:hypothetical protein